MACAGAQDAPQAAPRPVDLSGYCTVETAARTEVRPLVSGPPMPAYLGIALERDRRGRTVVAEVEEGSAAASAGVEPGDELERVGGKRVRGQDDLRRALEGKAPGETVALRIRRAGAGRDLSATLGAPSRPMSAAPRGAGAGSPATDEPQGPITVIAPDSLRPLPARAVYRLAVVGIEYPDVKHSAAIPTAAWTDMLFSKGVYHDKQSVTGQPVYGSVNDYYAENSVGAFRLEGRVFDWVTVGQSRSEYGKTAGAAGRALLPEALDALLARDGPEALKGYDGILFLYAGERVRTNRGNLYWPHRSTITHKGQRWSYFICPEGGSRMANISVFVHEFGHMLGLPDLYARPENPGSEGLGVWCAMSSQLANGRPQHFSAWCKERLGWLRPAVIDPAAPQKLLLAPVEGSATECYKVLIRPDGSEYLLLENRARRDFDANLPADGLLIWHVVGTRPILEESHGVEGPNGPRVHLRQVPYPSEANRSYTPYTVPSSRSLLGGGSPVFLTAIRRLPDGRIAFRVGQPFD